MGSRVGQGWDPLVLLAARCAGAKAAPVQAKPSCTCKDSRSARGDWCTCKHGPGAGWDLVYVQA